MDRIMKRIVSFLILFALFIVILTLPASETPAVHHDPMPLWSILLYLTVVMIAGVSGALLRRKESSGQRGQIAYSVIDQGL